MIVINLFVLTETEQCSLAPSSLAVTAAENICMCSVQKTLVDCGYKTEILQKKQM